MTEYWVSQGNKWCDYCKIYISSNATSIRTHESGTRHKENVAKKLAGIRKDNAAKERERLLATKDLGRIELEAMKSYERDLAAMKSEHRSSDTGKTSVPAAPGGSLRQADTSGKANPTGKSLSGKNRNGGHQVSNQSQSKSAPQKAPGQSISSAIKPGKGTASSLELGKRKRAEKPSVPSSEEAAALQAREAARKRVQEREKSFLGLYQKS